MTTIEKPSQARPESEPGPGRDAAAPSRGGHDPWNRLAAGGVGLFTFVIYWITLSPDVSFWDAGEFIATSHALGIPHPPGTPLYVLMGRVFSLLFSGLLGVASPAVAVNLLSAIPSSIAAVFLHLCVVRVGKRIWNGGNQAGFCLPALISGITAALFAAFANTLWINSIEAEVYAVSGMWAVFTAWLVLLWADSEPKDERLLVVIAYLLALNIGVHLATYLAALAILPFAFLHERRFAIPVSFVVVLLMAKDLQFFLLVVALLLLPTLQLGLLPSEYARRHRTNLLAAHGGAIVLSLWAVMGLEPSLFRNILTYGAPLAAFVVPWVALPAPKTYQNPFTDLGFLLALVTVLGFSCHLYLPIRSALNPAINEAQPDTWRAFWDVILRAQYRPASVFERQASWIFQIDDMFWRYFREQWQPAFLALLGIPGLLVHWKREKKTFVLFGLLFLWTSAALILKMNFTDHEVRERDYFFAPGFFYFAVWMGMGLGWLAHLVVGGLSSGLRPLVATATTVLCILISAVPLRGHWETHDRRGNWVAYDYGYNMLVALEDDAVLFTNGDNDTFPLWYLQEVHGFRKDVRIVNLSLLNTPWYGQQLREEEPKVPMSLTTEELWKMRPVRNADGEIFLVKDQVAMDIVNTAYAEGQDRPVYFAVTVEDMMGLTDYLKLEGLVFRLTPDHPNEPYRRGAPAESIDVEKEDLDPDPEVAFDVNLKETRRNLEDVYQYRGLLTEDGTLDDTVYRDENERRLVTNYAAAWVRMAIAYQELGNMDQAVECMLRAVQIVPDYAPITRNLGPMLWNAGRRDEARDFYLRWTEEHPEDLTGYAGLAAIARDADDPEGALEWYLRALRVAPDSREVLAGLFESYRQLGRLREAKNVLDRWVELHPEDVSARTIRDDLVRQIEQGSSAGEPSQQN